MLGSVAAVIAFTAVSVAGAKDENHDYGKCRATTIRSIIDDENDIDKDHAKVSLIGRVTKKLNGDSYLFEDSTGTIHLESDSELPLDQQIVIRGDVDQAYLHIGPLEVNVHSWRRVSKTQPDSGLSKN